MLAVEVRWSRGPFAITSAWLEFDREGCRRSQVRSRADGLVNAQAFTLQVASVVGQDQRASGLVVRRREPSTQKPVDLLLDRREFSRPGTCRQHRPGPSR